MTLSRRLAGGSMPTETVVCPGVAPSRGLDALPGSIVGPPGIG